MGLKAGLSSYCTKRASNGVNLVTSRKKNTRLARPMITGPTVIKLEKILKDVVMLFSISKNNSMLIISISGKVSLRITSII